MVWFPRWGRARHLPLLAVATLVVGLLVFLTGPPCTDVSGQFWLSGAMRHGARLYVDIVEINPPLWFWMAMPIGWLAEVLDVRPEPLVIVAVGIAVLGAIRAVARLLGPDESRGRTLFLVYLAGILLLMPARDFEQREHLALIGAVPYLVLAAVRREGRSLPPLLAIMIGTGAGVGFALKPYFLLVPVLIELWLLISLRRTWRPLRAETLALAAVGASYAAAVVILSPAYLADMVPLFVPAYQGMGPTFRQTISFVPLLWLAILYGIVSRLDAIWSGAAPLTVAFLIGALGFAVGWAMQHKGWSYQGIPTTGCLALALAASLKKHGWPTEFRVRIVMPALILWPLLIPLAPTEPPMTARIDIAPALVTLQKGDAFSVVSTNGPTFWPSTVDRGFRLSSRYGQFWMLDAIAAHPLDPAMQRLGRKVARETALDFQCLPPKVIVFIRFHRSNPDPSAVDDPRRYFMHDPVFAAVMDHYRLAKVGEIYDSYRQSSPLQPVNRATCRHSG